MAFLIQIGKVNNKINCRSQFKYSSKQKGTNTALTIAKAIQNWTEGKSNPNLSPSPFAKEGNHFHIKSGMEKVRHGARWSDSNKSEKSTLLPIHLPTDSNVPQIIEDMKKAEATLWNVCGRIKCYWFSLHSSKMCKMDKVKRNKRMRRCSTILK